MDLANHLIAMNRFRSPQDAADTFQVLTDHSVIDQGLGKKLKKMARFRNRLVHVYWNIENAVIYEYMQGDIEDIGTFLDRIGSLLSRGGDA